jgi:hypothetical protein
MIESNEANYNRIPYMLRLTPRQLFVPHAPIFDYIVWPQMRDNLIESGTKYCRPEVFGLLFVCCRIRNTPNADYVIHDGAGEPGIDPVLIAKLSDIENWVILDRFWNDYPELVKSLDPNKFMISEGDLV